MKLTSILQSLLFVSLLFTGLHAQPAHFNMPFDLNTVDMEIFSLVKDELESTRKILQDIHNSQNPALIKAAASSVGGFIKEVGYIGGALTLGCSVIVGFGLMAGLDLKETLNDPMGQGAVLVVLPFAIVSTIISYACLKIIFNKLLASSEKDTHHIKESLGEIAQSVHKLSYEIKKIERLMQLAKTQQLA